MIKHLIDELVREIDIDVRSEFDDKTRQIDLVLFGIRKAMDRYPDDEVAIGNDVVDMAQTIRNMLGCTCSDVRMHAFVSRLDSAFEHYVKHSVRIVALKYAKDMNLSDEEAEAFADALSQI